MGQGRGRRPSRGLSEKQQRFVRLIARGVSNAEACRRVGINRRTGTRWRFGRTVCNTAGEAVQYPPVRVPMPSKLRHPRYLSLVERTMMCDLRRERKTLREIAQAIGRSPSTVSRELRRNAEQSGRYLPHTAEPALSGNRS
jgi:transposase, IS30 family